VIEDAPPLLAAGLQEVSSARSLWARLVFAIDDGRLTPRATASLVVFRDLITALADVARKDSVSIAIYFLAGTIPTFRIVSDDAQI